jgi:hypothetical protein
MDVLSQRLIEAPVGPLSVDSEVVRLKQVKANIRCSGLAPPAARQPLSFIVRPLSSLDNP